MIVTENIIGIALSELVKDYPQTHLMDDEILTYYHNMLLKYNGWEMKTVHNLLAYLSETREVALEQTEPRDHPRHAIYLLMLLSDAITAEYE